jgi:NhaA family Na+:H+ antiporter
MTTDRQTRDRVPRETRASRFARAALAPIERFLAIESASGIVLLVAAAAAMLWASSPWHGSYEALWHAPLGLRLGPWSFERPIHFWVNDGLMAIFFFVVGLEIRREIAHGELSELRRAALPLAAALGGMVAPALIFAALNAGAPGARGWGVPMATDIAFAVGVLALLGKRVPPALRVLLLALAVIDDVGAIIVIALFYSSGLDLAGFLVCGAGLLAIVGLQAVRVRATAAYLLPALVAWAGAYAGGIHPTIAGVVVGLMTPVRAWPGDEESPVDRLERALHGWVAFGIMPLFALANAGIALGGVGLSGETSLVFLGVLAGLLVGKPLGITGLSWVAVKLGLASLPRGVTWPQVALVGVVGGIGFTMAIFIASLAFGPGPLLETSKLAIVCASAGAGLLALVVGRALLPAQPPPEGAPSAAEAEASTEL